MNTYIGDSQNVNLAELLGEGEELLAAVTIAINAVGEYAMNIADLDGAPVTMTPSQKAHTLRMLATAVEAEAIFDAPEETVDTHPAAEPAALKHLIGYGLLMTVPGATAVYLGEDADGQFTAPFDSPEKAIEWLDTQPGERRADAAVSTVAIARVDELHEAGHD